MHRGIEAVDAVEKRQPQQQLHRRIPAPGFGEHGAQIVLVCGRRGRLGRLLGNSVGAMHEQVVDSDQQRDDVGMQIQCVGLPARPHLRRSVAAVSAVQKRRTQGGMLLAQIRCDAEGVAVPHGVVGVAVSPASSVGDRVALEKEDGVGLHGFRGWDSRQPIPGAGVGGFEVGGSGKSQCGPCGGAVRIPSGRPLVRAWRLCL